MALSSSARGPASPGQTVVCQCYGTVQAVPTAQHSRSLFSLETNQQPWLRMEKVSTRSQSLVSSRRLALLRSIFQCTCVRGTSTEHGHERGVLPAVLF